MSAADHSEAGQARGVDRSHNRDTLSSEAMSDMLRDLQDAMLALDERLGTLKSSHAGASEDTRKLARGVADMGDALARRVRAIEQGGRDPPAIVIRREAAPPPIEAGPPRPRRGLAWVAALAVVLVVALAVFWLTNFQSIEHGAPAAAPKPVAVAPAAAPAVAASAANTAPAIPPPTSRPASHTVTAHRSTPGRGAYARALPSPGPSPAPTGFAHYGPSPSPPPPASAPTASRPPS